MKRHSIHSESCSGTSCVYRSRSKLPSVQQLLEEGSRVDRLYYGKYLPLRERKLLEKLIRTRAVYDDVRNQLLSTSCSSDQTRSEHKIRRQDDDSTEKSSAVLKIVDLVDRGQIGSSNTSKLSSCCSFCSCSHLRKIKKHMDKHPRVHKHHVPYEEIAKYTVEAEKRGRRRRKSLSTKISEKMRAVHFKMKQVRSEPCTCTLSLHSMHVKHSSKALVKRKRSKEIVRTNTQPQKVVTIERKALKKKICSCSCKIGKLPMKSLHKIKNIRKSTTMSSGTEFGKQNAFKIKKDSLTLFREKLLKKRAMKDWECEPGICVIDECIPEECHKKIKNRGVGEWGKKDYECEPGICVADECIPEECHKKIKNRSIGERGSKKMHNRISGTGRHRTLISMSTHAKKAKKHDSRVQSTPKSSLGTVICECKPISKSTSSMTSFPKSKDSKSLTEINSITTEIMIKRSKSPKLKQQLTFKEKDEDAHKIDRYKTKKTDSYKVDESERVQVTPKSNLGSVICECKPASKTTSFITDISKSFVEIKVKRSITPKKKSRLLPEETLMEERTYKVDHYKPQKVESFKTELVRASPKSNLGHIICECKPTTKSISSMTTITKTESKKQDKRYKIERYKAGKLQNMVLPFPRECEPLMCIPDNCDPENCARILLSRSKSQRRSTISSTDHIRHKSTGSTTSSLKTSSNSRYIQSKSMESFIPKAGKREKKEPPRQIVEKDVRAESTHPQKQAVKIGSSFSFSVEFSKVKSPGTKTDDTQKITYESKKEHKQKNYQKKKQDRGHGARNIKYHQTSSQSRSSQSIKNIQVGHRLKRCFCTLKLLQKKKQKVKHVASKKTMASFYFEDHVKRARIRETQTKSSGIAYVIPPVTPLPLLPYECEPFFCTPGDCNPYRCAERIKARDRCFCKETNTISNPRKSSLTFTPQKLSKSSSRKIQSDDHKHRELKKRRPQKHMEYTETSSKKPEKQAVRIGSSYSFQIEFSKHKTGQQGTPNKETEYTFETSKPIKKEKKRIQQKGIKVHKPRVRHMTSETPIRAISSKQTTTPFLERCFCTLKLLNKNNKQAETVEPLPSKNYFTGKNKSITTNRANVNYHYKPAKLLPYEYEPGIIRIPDKCDRYDCEKRIKLRPTKLQHRHSNTGGLTARSTLSTTSRTVTSFKSGNTPSMDKGSVEHPKKIKGTYKETNALNVTSSHSNRQAVRIGSNFSFNIEFYKDKSLANDNIESISTLRDKPIRKHEYQEMKLKATRPQKLKPQIRNKVIDIETKGKDKGIHVGAAIKRCFCTLKFHKKGKKAKSPKKVEVISKSTKTSYPLPDPEICECKSTSTKKKIDPEICECKSTSTKKNKDPEICPCKSTSTKKNKSVYDLKPYECVPGTCNPYECYEEIKRRGIRLHDRNISTEKNKRKSIMSMTVSEFSGSSKLKKKQSRFVKQLPKQDHKARVVREDICPCEPTPSISRSRQSVRIGSNFSFNIEFNRFTSAVQDITYKTGTAKHDTASDTTLKKIKNRGTKDKRGLKHRLSQASNIVRKENKASNVGFMLKRCFCTLGLQKKNVVTKTKKPKHDAYLNLDMHGNQPITTQFVHVLKIKPNQFNNYEMQSKNNFPNRSSTVEKPLQLQEVSYPFKASTFGVNKKSQETAYVSECLSDTSFTTSPQFRSHIGVENNREQTTTQHFRKYYKSQDVSTLNNDTQKKNPFYQSFYALNVKVSNLKHVPANTHSLEDNECEPGVCIPGECDPAECLKRINNRLKRSKLSGTDRPKTKSVMSITKVQLESKSKINARSKKNKIRPCQNNYSSSSKKFQQISHLVPQDGSDMLRVGSNISFSMEFYKERISDNGVSTSVKSKQAKEACIRGTRASKGRFQDNDSQMMVTKQNKATISPLLKRCFCTLKFKPKSKDHNVACCSKKNAEIKHKKTKATKNVKESKKATKIDKKNKKNTKAEKDESTMAKNPYGKVTVTENRKVMTNKLEPYECAPNVCIPGECDPNECYKLIQKRLKTCREHCVGTNCKTKHKSTGSLTKKGKNIKTKKAQSKYKEPSTCCKNNAHRKYLEHEKQTFRPPGKQTVTFGSNLSCSMEFFKDTTRSLSSNFPTASTKPGAEIYQQSRVSNVYCSKGSGDNRKKTKSLGRTGKMEDAGNNVANMLSKCFCALKLAKNASKCCVNTEHKPKQDNKKVKSILKSCECGPKISVPDKCVPCDMNVKKRQLRSKNTKVNREKRTRSVKSAVINKRTATKGEQLSKSFECEPYTCITDDSLKARGIISKNVENKSKSILKRCVCVLTQKRSKKPKKNLNEGTCGYCEPNIDSLVKNKTNLNSFVKKCVCKLKHMKGGKVLKSKLSTATICCNRSKTQKCTVKLEKKKANKAKCCTKQEKEMETIMPYCKKKFKKHVSKTKLANNCTNTMGSYACSCPRIQCKPLQNTTVKFEKKSRPVKNKKPLSQSESQLINCPVCKEDISLINKNKIKRGKKSLDARSYPNEQYEPQTGMCPICKSSTRASSKKQKLKKDKHLQNVQSDVCPVCKVSTCANKKQNNKKAVHSGICPEKHIGDQSDICPVCNARTNLKTKKGEKKRRVQEAKANSIKNNCNKCKKKGKSSDQWVQCPICKAYMKSNTCSCPNYRLQCLHCGYLSKTVTPKQKSNKTCGKSKSFDSCPGSNDSAKDDTKLNKSKTPCMQNDAMSDLCPVCRAKCTLAKSLKDIINKWSGFLTNRKKKAVKPIFEMVVRSADNVHIVNKKDVLEKLGKDSEIMKQSQKAMKKGKVAPPLLELYIDKTDASIINSEEILQSLMGFKSSTTCEEQERGKINKRKAGTSVKCRSYRGVETYKKAVVKQHKSEPGATKPHSSSCQCCECKRLKLFRKKKKSSKEKVSGKKKPDEKGKGKGKGKGKEKEKGKGKGTGKEKEEEKGKGKGKGGAGDAKGKTGAKVAIKPRKLKPCVCGSIICKKDWTKIKKDMDLQKKIKIKPCVCGSNVCKKEQQKMPDVLLKAVLKQERDIENEKQRKIREKRYHRDRLLRKKLYAKQDAKLWARRRKQDRRDMKYVRKYDDIPDTLAVAESGVDFGKFGGKAFCDIMRCVCRVARHPRDGYYNVKDAIKDPRRAVKEAEKSCKGTGFFATIARTRRRFRRMRLMKDAMEKLESHPVSNFIVHLPDKNPKKRMKKFKKKRFREPLDFECSLFMASLRKRPCLRVYYMCPWFYPHCMSLLLVWKQFTDVLLFILAVGVWSPCILCMEFCRAMMCCFLCTG